MAKDLAHRLGMHPDGGGEQDYSEDDDDSKKWFNKLMEYIDFNDSLRRMLSEEEQENLRKEAHRSQDEDDDNDDDGDDDEDDNTGSDPSTPMSDVITDSDHLCDMTDSDSITHHIVNPLLDHLETTNGAEETPSEKRAPF